MVENVMPPSGANDADDGEGHRGEGRSGESEEPKPTVFIGMGGNQFQIAARQINLIAKNVHSSHFQRPRPRKN